jgi:uncharacterized membrane protein
MALMGIAAVLALAAAFFGSIFPGADPAARVYLVSVSFAIVAASATLELKGRGGQMDDERTRKIERASMAASWTLSFVAIGILIALCQFGTVSLTAPEALAAIFFFMVAMEVSARAYFEAKGDAE